MSFDRDSNPPSINVLALDGGGVRGLSSLLILRELMQRMGIRRSTDVPVRPSDFFDLIIGTGTGGIAALFRGRMRMAVDEAIKEYATTAEMAEKPSTDYARWFLEQRASLNGDALEKTIGDIVGRVLKDREARLEDPPGEYTNCRTAVLAATSANVDAPAHIFRSYVTKQRASSFTIHGIARAAVCTAGLFPPVALENSQTRFIDASLAGYGNPAEVGLAEAAALWPDRRINCLVSLGTGLQNIVSVDERWSEVSNACAAIVQSYEQVHDRVLRRRQRDDFLYFRFNVDRGLAAVDSREWSGAVQRGHLAGTTEAYMFEWLYWTMKTQKTRIIEYHL